LGMDARWSARREHFFFLVRSFSGANQKKNASEDVRPCSYEQYLLACSGPF